MKRLGRLEISLALLLGLTGAAMGAGGARGAEAPGTVGIAVALALGALKARIVLAEYLHLRAAPGWLTGFTMGLGVLVAVLVGLALIA